MQSIEVKKGEIIKINGERFYVEPSLDDNVKLAKVTKERESYICKNLLDRVYAHEIKGYLGCYIEVNDRGELCFKITDRDNMDVSKIYYLKYIRLVKDPINYGLEDVEGVNYLLYCDYDNNDI